MSVSSPWPTYSGASAIAWTPTLAAVLIVGTRTYTRYRIRALGLDDYLMLVAAAWALSFAALSQANYSMRPTNSWERAQYWTKYSMGSITLYMSLLFAKCSIGCFLLRLLSPSMKGLRWFIGISLAGWLIVTWFRLISAFYPVCSPQLLAVPVFTGCFEYRWSFGFAQLWNFYSIFIDIAYSTIPVMMISKLKINGTRKAILGVLVGLGWVAVIFTLIRAVAPYRPSLNSAIGLVSFMEMNIVMICGSLATLTPLYMYWFEGVPLQSRRQAQVPNQFGDSNKPMLAKISMSTVESGQTGMRQDSMNRQAPGIRVDREFHMSSSQREDSMA